MDEILKLVVFQLGKHYYALPHTAVTRVLRAVAITPFPTQSATLRGLINVQGSIVPVLDLHQKLGLPSRGIGLSDHFIMAHTDDFAIVMNVDQVAEVLECPTAEMTDAGELIGHCPWVSRIVKQPNRMILLLDLSQLLSEEEKQQLSAMEREAQKNEP